jgi:arabinofuranosyltransferase
MSSKKSSKKNITKSSKKSQTHGKKAPVKSNKYMPYFILTVLGIVFYYYCKSFNFIQDDSYITFRYVKNFTEGNGLVFNIGEHVEGYTCFFWVVVLSLLKIMGFDFISASSAVGILSSLGTLFFTYKISEQIFPKNNSNYFNTVFSLTAVLMLVSNGAFAYWAVSGMETGLFTLLVTTGIYLYLRENQNQKRFPYSSIIFLLASLTRPEGNLIFAVTILHKIIVALKRNRETRSGKLKLLFSKNNLLWLLFYLVPALIYMIWRYSYYGYLLPNTFYAKTGSSIEYFKAGLDYFWDFASSYGLYGILIALTLITLKSKDRFNEYLYLILQFFIFSVYVIFVGGDVLRPGRFFVPLLPVYYILIQESFYTLILIWQKNRKVSLTTPATIVLIAAAAFSWFSYTSHFDTIKRYSELENGLVEKMELTGKWLKSKQTEAGKRLTVAASTIGAISYFSEVDLIDMLGLTDKVIAHDPKPIPEISSKSEIGWKERNYNVDYVLSRKPDYIYFSTGIKPSAYAERGLFTSPVFLEYYYPSYFTIRGYSFTDCIYKRKTDAEVRADSTKLPPNPNYNKAYVNLYNQAMNTSRDKSKLQEAIDLYKKTLEEAPSNFGTPYSMIGDIYMQMKNSAKAFENYKKAVEIDDYNVMAHYYLYRLYLERGDTANALDNLEKIQKYSPDMLN